MGRVAKGRQCPLLPHLLLYPYLSRNNLASHTVPFLAGHSGIILIPTPLSLSSVTLFLPPSLGQILVVVLVGLGRFPWLPAIRLGQILKYFVLSAYRTSAITSQPLRAGIRPPSVPSPYKPRSGFHKAQKNHKIQRKPKQIIKMSRKLRAVLRVVATGVVH